MNRRRSPRFDVGHWAVRTLGEEHLIGRIDGAQCREAIEATIQQLPGGSTLTVDCWTLDHLDFTGADECVAKLANRLQNHEYGDTYLLLAGITPVQEENITVALERRGACLLVQEKDGPRIIGHLNPYLQDAFSIMHTHKAVTARELADWTDEQVSLTSTKLLSLHKAHVVTRASERLPNGGRQFVYRLVEGDDEVPRDADA
jgi:hypothetical protein